MRPIGIANRGRRAIPRTPLTEITNEEYKSNLKNKPLGIMPNQPSDWDHPMPFSVYHPTLPD